MSIPQPVFQKEKRIASIAVFDRAGRMLFGRRRDNGRWSLAGGGASPNETMAEAAKRELMEETGMVPLPNTLREIGHAPVAGPNKMTVHAFRCVVDGQAHGRFDPDSEFYEFQWHLPHEIPDYILNNLHSPRNIVLWFLGIQHVDEKGNWSQGAIKRLDVPREVVMDEWSRRPVAGVSVGRANLTQEEVMQDALRRK